MLLTFLLPLIALVLNHCICGENCGTRYMSICRLVAWNFSLHSLLIFLLIFLQSKLLVSLYHHIQKHFLEKNIDYSLSRRLIIHFPPSCVLLMCVNKPILSMYCIIWVNFLASLPWHNSNWMNTKLSKYRSSQPMAQGMLQCGQRHLFPTSCTTNAITFYIRRK